MQAKAESGSAVAEAGAGMTNVSRSTSSIQANPRILALALAALRLGLIIEGPPTLPFPKDPK